MNAINKIRSFAESREPDVAVIRDGITYGDARELLQEIDLMRRRVAATEKAHTAVVNSSGYCDRCNRWSYEISQDEETGADLCEECQFKAEEEMES